MHESWSLEMETYPRGVITIALINHDGMMMQKIWPYTYLVLHYFERWHGPSNRYPGDIMVSNSVQPLLPVQTAF